MIDIQNLADGRNIPLHKVGVKGVRSPVTVLDKKKGTQHTVGLVDLFADLPKEFKGTHMSRFIEAFQRHHQDLSMPRFLEMLEEIRTDLDASAAFGSLSFTYFMDKKAPASGLESAMAYECRYEGEVYENHRNFYVSVAVPVQTVCPCSKAISDRGAHNQRGVVKIVVKLGPFFWIEDLIAIAEEAASSPVFSLLKREDEKFVTEYAYDRPKFVEDLVRDVYIGIKALERFPWFSVEAENFESIHNHNAFAYAEFGSRGVSR